MECKTCLHGFFKDAQSFSTTIVGRLIVNDKEMMVISELKSRNSCVGSEKENLFFFFSHAPSNLVSDEGNGITLPNNSNGTHNIALSPFFLNRTGSVGLFARYRGSSGETQELQASTIFSAGGSYYLHIWLSGTQPSGYYDSSRGAGISLRCLVSNTNS